MSSANRIAESHRDDLATRDRIRVHQSASRILRRVTIKAWTDPDY
jgi:hypothetical protein